MTSCSCQAVLLDIEGTTSSIRFVHDVLFPFARRHLKRFLDAHWDDPPTRAACARIAHDAGTTLDHWMPDPRAAVRAEVERLMDGDVKATGLKELQGLIWEEGYRSGELRSHVYDDVPPALRRCRDRDIDVHIYSSGSVQAQRLFFEHTTHGNLLPWIHGHYDTRIGPKKEPDSYRAIAQDVGRPVGAVLFVSDVRGELDAARAAGLKTAMMIRPDNPPQNPGPHPVLRDFAVLALSVPKSLPG